MQMCRAQNLLPCLAAGQPLPLSATERDVVLPENISDWFCAFSKVQISKIKIVSLDKMVWTTSPSQKVQKHFCDNVKCDVTE